jgi:alkanesulfonate monooxygenase SsuD/methylene tetrahydromethanopterin reductase-like flavin-dependent oxidoreductase (luciferase family)
VPTTLVTHTEPFHVSKAIATLDYVSTGRAGLRAQISARADDGRLFGRREIRDFGIDDLAKPEVAQLISELFEEATDYVAVVRRLWDSSEDDTEIRDAATGRFIDRDKIHYIDFTGKHLSVKGPSIVPRPSQGQPLVTALARSTVPYRFAARSADVVYVTPTGRHSASDIVGEVHAEQRGAGRSADIVRPFGDLVVLDSAGETGAARKARMDDRDDAEYTSDAHILTGSAGQLADLLADWQQAGITGYRLRPGALPDDLTSITAGLVPELQRRGLFRDHHAASTLRGLLNLTGPATVTPAPLKEQRRERANQSNRTADIREVRAGCRRDRRTRADPSGGPLPRREQHTVCSDPRSGSHIEVESFVRFAKIAERANFDFLFLAEGLRLREQAGKIYDLDVVGRPDTFTVLWSSRTIGLGAQMVVVACARPGLPSAATGCCCTPWRPTSPRSGCICR